MGIFIIYGAYAFFGQFGGGKCTELMGIEGFLLENHWVFGCLELSELSELSGHSLTSLLSLFHGILEAGRDAGAVRDVENGSCYVSAINTCFT